MKRLLDAITEHPGRTLLLVAVATLLALSRVIDPFSGEVRIRFDPSLNRLLPEDDERRSFYDRIRLQFGNDENLVVAYVAEDGVLEPQHLERIARLTERLEGLSGVHHVLSLTTAADVRGTPDGDVVVTRLVDRIPETPEEVEALRRRTFASRLYAGNLISADATAAALSVHLSDISEREFLARNLDQEIARIAEEESADAEVWITGGPYLKAATTRRVVRDMSRILPLALAAIGLMAAVAFRTVRGVLVPLTTVVVALVWSLAVVADSGRSLTLVTVVIPPLILTIGFAYTVHVLTEYRELRSAAAALRTVAMPVVLTGITTAGGLAALAASPLVAIREFAFFGAVAALLTVVAALTLTPALLALMREPTPSEHSARFDRFFRALGAFVMDHRRGVLVGAGLLAVLSLVGMSRIEVSSNLLGNFAEDDPVRVHYDAVNQSLEGANLFYVVFEGDERGALLEPDVLREMRAFQQWLEAQPEVGGTTSLADFVMSLHQAFLGGDEAAFEIPESRALVSQILFFAAGDELERFVDSQRRTAAVAVRAGVSASPAVRELFARIETHLAARELPVRTTITGNSALVIHTMDELSRGQVQSLGAAFLLILGILAALFTSLRVGLLALLPNALPVLIYFGAMGFSGVTLNPTTSLIACIVLGIAVDDTIHYLVRFDAAARGMADERRGAIETLVSVGRPITITSAALCLGFLAMATSELHNQVMFGSLAAFTLAAAWLVDVLMTPALSAGLRVVTLWEVLTLDLGEDPQRSIPLFRGLSNAQARTVALMSETQELPANHTLFRTGDAGENMYVVLEGEVELRLAEAAGGAQHAVLRRGDVLGEVALVGGLRQADAHAITDTRLLRFSQPDLARLRRRYRRTGRRFLQNLSELLIDRLGRLEPERRLNLMRFVCSFAWADAQIQPDERRLIARMVERLELDAADSARVADWLEHPPRADIDAEAVPLEHRMLFVESIQALILADGEIHPDELALLKPLIS